MPSYARDKGRVEYIPAITLLPSVYGPDGQARVYTTASGSEYWNSSLPVLKGDSLRLNVAVATGGADLARVIVRLDNNKLADISASPWSTAIDTTRLAPGTHMIEAWAQTGANPPQASTQTLSFMVVDQLPASIAVAASEEKLFHTTSDVIAPVSVTPPAFLTSASSDPAAAVRLRSSDPAVDRALIAHDSSLSIGQPEYISVERAPNSTAVQFAYELARDGVTVASSSTPSPVGGMNIKLEPRSGDSPGLLPGTLVLSVWGIDASGAVGEPVTQTLVVGGGQ